MGEVISLANAKAKLRDFLIVVVDDCQYVRESIATVLRHAAFQVVEASNGREAFEKITKHKYRNFFLVTDFNMPGLRGDQLIDELEKNPESRAVGYALVSSHLANHPEIKKMLSKKLKSAIRFFEKPLSFDDLIPYLKMFKDRSFRPW